MDWFAAAAALRLVVDPVLVVPVVEGDDPVDELVEDEDEDEEDDDEFPDDDELCAV